MKGEADIFAREKISCYHHVTKSPSLWLHYKLHLCEEKHHKVDLIIATSFPGRLSKAQGEVLGTR